MAATAFNDFVLTTCTPGHVRAARMGLSDWTQVDETSYHSPSTGMFHNCVPHLCSSWVLRFVDGVKICAISGKLILNNSPSSLKKRASENFGEKQQRDEQMDSNVIEWKRHQDKPIPGSSAYLMEKFQINKDIEDCMHIDNEVTYVNAPSPSYRLNQYPY